MGKGVVVRMMRLRREAGQKLYSRLQDNMRTTKRQVPNIERFASLSMKSRRRTDVPGLDTKGGSCSVTNRILKRRKRRYVKKEGGLVKKPITRKRVTFHKRRRV